MLTGVAIQVKTLAVFSCESIERFSKPKAVKMQYQDTGHSVMPVEWCRTASISPLKLFHSQLYLLCCADGTQRDQQP